ncbi:hypothetical protein CTZ27_28380 [Streptomyces griseocarneus]|nr:hypothetical protein CTZ27_28380 [Streptomyces griseocarneus]
MSPVVQSPPGVGELRYAADLTLADVDALEAFLTSRTDDVRRAHGFGNGVHCTVVSFQHALFLLCRELRDVFECDDGSRGVLRAKFRLWNQLCGIAACWADTDGYDRDRWRRADYYDAAKETEVLEHRRRRLRWSASRPCHWRVPFRGTAEEPGTLTAGESRTP